ncbi:uncharacterized protein LOC134413402 [Elgaria multicarinata webbii]|uniref:uncharacterized protein LOC134413402 n=1 Tax=Elgaria multicarinata webbii TaxID=159646 RepID=UPI002FCCD20D
MERYTWRVLATLGLVVAATALDPQQDAPLSYEEAVSSAIDFYNHEPEVAFAFHLLEARPQPEWDSLSNGVQELAFTMKETTCPTSEQRNLDECAFKEDGLVMECSGTLSVDDQGNRDILLNCETVAQEHIRVRRRIFRKIFRKVKKGIKKVFKGKRILFHLGRIPIHNGPPANLGNGYRNVVLVQFLELFISVPPSHVRLGKAVNKRPFHRKRSTAAKMDSCPWRVLVTLGLVVSTTALPPQQKALSYEEAISLAIDFYNEQPGVAFAFQLLEAKPQLEWDPWTQAVQELAFTVKETTCLTAEELNLDECDFKDDGVVKKCSGTFLAEQEVPKIQLSCDDVAQEERIRVRRDFRSFLRKLKRRYPGSWSQIAHGHGREVKIA